MTDEAEITFPIDLVYTWVDGTDGNLNEIRNEFKETMPSQQQHVRLIESTVPSRWKNIDLLQYSIESVDLYAPWINHIYIITDNQTPSWYGDGSLFPHITIVDHTTLFTDLYEDHLPTFNSHAIECHLHRVPGLNEHFIYANDDTLLGDYVEPEDFFQSDERAKIFLSPSYPMYSELPQNKYIQVSAYVGAQVNTNRVLDQIFGKERRKRMRLKHQMKPLRKSMFEFCWNDENMGAELFNTSSTKFRSLEDIDPTCLVSYVSLKKHKAVTADISSKYYGLMDSTDLRRVFRHMVNWKPLSKLICVNYCIDNPTEEKMKQLKMGLDKYLPHRYQPTVK